MTNNNRSRATRRVTVLDVGHGSCSIIESGERVVVVDGGLGASLLYYLEQQEIEAIDCVLLSHSDADHIGGVVALLSSGKVTVREVRLNPDGTQHSKTWDDLVYELHCQQKRAKLVFETTLTSSNPGSFTCGDLTLQIAGPSSYLATKSPGGTTRSGARVRSNSVSAVVRVVFEGRSVVLLTGDVDDVGFREMVTDQVQLSAEVLVFPHHGGGLPSEDVLNFTKEICEAVRPTTVLFSIGRDNRYWTPKPEVVEQIRKTLERVRVACTELSVHCSVGIPQTPAKHLNGVYARGRADGKCCAGSVLLEIGDVTSVVPTVANHGAFIATAVATPLCGLRR